MKNSEGFEIPELYVNSYPRTGSSFFRTAIIEYFKLSNNEEYIIKTDNKHDFFLFADKTKNIVTILRNPRLSIVSLVASHYEKTHMDFENVDNLLDEMVESWAPFIDECILNINNIYPFLFEQVTKYPNLCLDDLASTFNLQTNLIDKDKVYGIYREKRNDIQITSTNSNKYLEILKKYDDLNIDKKNIIFKKYNEYKKQILIRQADLNWKSPYQIF